MRFDWPPRVRRCHWALCALVAAAASWSAPVASVQCPASADGAPPEHMLTMDCRGACADTYSPCLYYADASLCEAARNETASSCVSVSSSDGSTCAFECFTPFSGAANDTWNLMVTNEYEYKLDVLAAEARDPDFRIAKKSATELSDVSDLMFPPGTTRISISGNALPVDIKSVNYVVLDSDESVNFSVPAEALGNATDCRDLRIENINMATLASFPVLPNLQKLILSNVELTDIPDGLANLTNITSLDLSQNALVSLGANSIPPNVVDFLRTVPSELLTLPDLLQLDLSANEFSLPSAGSLPLQLETFIYYEMYQTTLPPDLMNMTSLKYLDIGWNGFDDSAQIEALPSTLVHLGLSSNYLSDLPTPFSELTSLRELDISFNSFRGIAPTTLPPSLTLLNASSNAIKSLPDNLLPPSLEFLNLSYNNLDDSLPVGFANLQNLTDLYLEGNYFSTIPSAIFSLSSLKRLSLSSDQNVTGKVTLSRPQIDFLSNLDTFIIDGDSVSPFFSTTCESPVQVHNYTVCVAEVTTAASNDGVASSGGGSYAWLYVTALVLATLLLIVGGVLMFQRQHRSGNATNNPKSSKEPRSLFCLDSSYENAVATLGDINEASNGFFSVSKTPVDGKTSARSTASGEVSLSSLHAAPQLTSMTSSISIWDDEDLLKVRMDIQQLHAVELLGSGYYGEVWLATYASAHVVAKRLKNRHPDRREIMRFVSEIKTHLRFDHPKIVSLIGVVWTMESDVQAVLEYMDGGDLRSYLSSLPLAVAADASATDYPSGVAATPTRIPSTTSYWDSHSLSIAIDIAEALVYLHSLDPAVLHRDLKSRNVLLDGCLRAKLTDFGVSTEAHEDEAFGSESVAVMTCGVGTARWAAPEVLAGSDRYTMSVDIYSFGVILSELDTRRTPFSECIGMSENFLLSQIAAGEAQPTFSLDTPSQVLELARKCLSFDASQRPSAVEAAFLLRLMQQSGTEDKSEAWGE